MSFRSDFLRGGPVFAQKGEIFGGASYTRIDVSPDANIVGLEKITSYGLHESVTEYINNWFGATADFSGMFARPTISIKAYQAAT